MTITQAFLTSEITNLWPDNNTGAITPADARQTLNDMVTATFQGLPPSALSTSNTWTALQTFSSGALFSNGANGISGVADLRLFGATPGVNCQPAVASAVAAGYKHVFLPSGYFYQGGGTGGESGATEIPADLEIIGEDPRTSIIKAVDRTNAGIPGFIYLNSFSILTNCGTQSYPGDQQTSPAGNHPKTSLQPRVISTGDAKTTDVFWTGATVLDIGTNITSPEGVVSTDNPGFQIVQRSAGDAFYALTTTNGIGFRMQTSGSGDEGLRIDNAIVNPANVHNGMHIVELGTNSSSSSLVIERKVGSTCPLFVILDDNIGSPATAPSVSFRVADSGDQYLFAGTTKAARMWTNSTGFTIEGVDAATGATSYQPLTVGGSELFFGISGATKATLFPSGGLGLGSTPIDPGAPGCLNLSSTTQPQLVINNPGGQYSVIELTNSGVIQTQIYWDNTNGITVFNSSAGHINIDINSVLALGIFNSGGVGIGAAPSDPGTGGLHVTGVTGIGTAASSSTFLKLAAATTAKSVMQLTVGGPPTSPNDGDIWFESNTTTGIKVRINGVTHNFTIT